MINTELLLQALILMGKGMLGIFIVIIAIMAVVMILTRVTAKNKEENKNQ